MKFNLRKICLNLAAAALAVITASASAAPIDVLWLSGNATYNTDIATLGAGGVNDASTWDPDLDGSNTWTIDFWSAGVPDFAAYDVLVIGSTCRPGCPGAGGGASTTFFDLGVTPDLVLANEAALDAARGSRTFVSGQDADWHFTKDGPADSANARGFLVNAVNWAATGTDLGIVVLADGYPGSTDGWLHDDDSFLQADINGSRTEENNESVVIPGAVEAAFPINEGLSSAQLSNWGTSSHTKFEKALLDPTVWTTINDFGPDSAFAVTIVSADTAGGGTVPEPGTLALFGLGVLGILGARRRRALAAA